MIDVRGRLSADDLPKTVRDLGFRGSDVAAVLAAAEAVVRAEPELAVVGTLAQRLIERIGLLAPQVPGPLEDYAAETDHLGVGVLPLLALLVTAPEVAAFHARRGIDADVSARSLSDLGQQAWAHRQVHARFGLETYWWLSIAWSGAFYWLGRLQFNLARIDEAWVLSTHIPATGPLTPALVDDAFRRAVTFFATHFPDYPTVDFHCSSWLLDPQLTEVLEPESNLVRFQRRWSLYGEPMRGDEDVLYFAFSRRGPVDLDALPHDTSLRRAVVERLQEGRHWNVWQGRIPQSTFRIEDS